MADGLSAIACRRKFAPNPASAVRATALSPGVRRLAVLRSDCGAATGPTLAEDRLVDGWVGPVGAEGLVAIPDGSESPGRVRKSPAHPARPANPPEAAAAAMSTKRRRLIALITSFTTT